MLTIVHAADFHLDSPFRALPEDKAAQRRAEQRELLDRLADLARDRGADLLLLAGDLFDGRTTFYETAQALARSLGSLDIPVFIAPGNHDFWSPASPYASIRWPDNVRIFTGGMERVELPGLGCAVYGGAFTAPVCERSLLAGFRPQEDPGLTRLMILHGDLTAGGRYNPITPEQLAASGMDYVALGHVHAASGVLRAGSVSYAYHGCPEGRGFDELGDKGVLAGRVDRGRAELDFVPLCKRRYQQLEVDRSRCGSPEEALEAVLPRLDQRDICRLVFTGEWDGLDLAALAPRAEAACYHAVLRDRTSPRRDLWRRQEESNLTGLFLRELARRLSQAGDHDRPMLERAVRFGMAALEGGEEP